MRVGFIHVFLCLPLNSNGGEDRAFFSTSFFSFILNGGSGGGLGEARWLLGLYWAGGLGAIPRLRGPGGRGLGNRQESRGWVMGIICIQVT